MMSMCSFTIFAGFPPIPAEDPGMDLTWGGGGESLHCFLSDFPSIAVKFKLSSVTLQIHVHTLCDMAN